MDHRDHKNLIQPAITTQGGVWADFGSGWGAFTLALRDLTGENVEIYSVDKNSSRLKEQAENFRIQFPNTNINFINSDFTKQLELPKLDGILMANSLHYIKNQVQFLQNMKNYLKPNGKIVVIEYETDSKNFWLPNPVSSKKFVKLAFEAGFRNSVIHQIVNTDSTTKMYCGVTVLNYFL